MSATPHITASRLDPASCKAIFCILPDDGTDRRLLIELRKNKGVVRSGSATRRGIGALAQVKTKRGHLPLPNLVKQVFVICTEDQAEEIFDFMFWSAEIDRPGRGLIWQQALSGCTPFTLPEDIPDEASEGIS